MVCAIKGARKNLPRFRAAFNGESSIMPSATAIAGTVAVLAIACAVAMAFRGQATDARNAERAAIEAQARAEDTARIIQESRKIEREVLANESQVRAKIDADTAILRGAVPADACRLDDGVRSVCAEAYQRLVCGADGYPVPATASAREP